MKDTKEILHKTGEKLGHSVEVMRRTTMNASSKVQSCFDARVASLIIGIIMSVLSGLLVLSCIGGLVYVFVIVSMQYDLYLMQHSYNDPFHSYQVIDIMTFNAFITATLIFSLLEFSFSVVLAEGASKKNAGHLRAYFIYGNIKITILCIFALVLYIIVWENFPGHITLLLAGLSTVKNMVVYVARKNIKTSPKEYLKSDTAGLEQA